MGKIYATREDTKERFLVEIECDGSGCEESIKPSSDVPGWIVYGQDTGPPDQRERWRWYYCPECASHLNI